MDLNYFGTVNMVKALLPAMLERGSGHIVNISSVAAFLGVFGYSAYGASKYAVRGFSDVLRAEVKPLGVRVSVVFPPDMDTPGLANENKTKPFETHEIEGKHGCVSSGESSEGHPGRCEARPIRYCAGTSKYRSSTGLVCSGGQRRSIRSWTP